MRVEELRLDPWGDGRELSGRVIFERADLEPQRLWFRSPVPPTAGVDASPFLPALLILSMKLGERLAIDGPVSPRLVEQVEGASLVIRSWWPQLEPARVEPAELAAPAGGGEELGVFFTRGVDSWHSVLDTLREDRGAVCLVGWPGANLAPPLDTPEREQASATALTDAARLVPARLDLMESNLRRVVEPHIRWAYTHGGLLAALALAHGGLGEARIAGTLPLGSLVPLGSHPLLDPLWSTEATEVVHHAPEVARVEKVAELAEHSTVLGTLKVCDVIDPRRNCGQCGKCVRTMIGLEIAGALGRAPFDARLTRRGVTRLPVSTSIEREFGYELIRALSEAQRHDLSEPLQIAFATDQVRRAWRRMWAVIHGRRRRGHQLWSRAG